MHLSFAYRVSRYFPYRVAWPVDIVLETHYGNDSSDPIRKFQNELHAQAGTHRDNHEGFEIVHRDDPEKKLYVFFSDWTMRIARSYSLGLGQTEDWAVVVKG
jgi:hypothetical protein